MLSIPKILNGDQISNDSKIPNKKEEKTKILEKSSTEDKEESKEDQTEGGEDTKEDTKEETKEDAKEVTQEVTQEETQEETKEAKATTNDQKENEGKIRQVSIMKKILPKDDTENPCNFCGEDLCECFKNAELYSVYAKNRCYMAYDIRYKDKED